MVNPHPSNSSQAVIQLSTLMYFISHKSVEALLVGYEEHYPRVARRVG